MHFYTLSYLSSFLGKLHNLYGNPTPGFDSYKYFKFSLDHFTSYPNSGFIDNLVPSLEDALQESLTNGDPINILLQNVNSGSISGIPGTVTSVNQSQDEAVITSSINFKPIGIIVKSKYKTESIAGSNSYLGGGIRVKEIKLKDDLGTIINHQKYNYTFEDPVNGTFSSGVTATEPPSFVRDNGINNFIDNPLLNVFHAITPGVLYSEVTVENIKNGNQTYGKSVYKFEAFDPAVHLSFNTQTYGTNNVGVINTIEDKTSQIGRPLSVETYNKEGHITSKTEYEYYADSPNRQGITKEVNHAIRSSVSHVGDPWLLLNGFNWKGVPNYEFVDWQVNINEKIKYPSVLKSITKDEEGLISKSTNLEFDFHTGQVTKTQFEDAYGQKFKKYTVPAYWKYSEMGSKVDNADNKHMLAQPTANYVYKLDQSEQESGLIAAGVTTWKDDWTYRIISGNKYANDEVNNSGIWRNHQAYSWKSDLNEDGTFIQQPTIGSSYFDLTESNWTLTNEISRYDHFSMEVEEKDINDNYATSKLGYNESLVLTTTANAKYTEIAYSGAEDLIAGTSFFGGEVHKGSGTQSTTYTHTGNYSLSVGSGQTGFTYRADIDGVNDEVDATRKYVARVWVRDAGSANASHKLKYSFQSSSGGSEVTAANPLIEAGDWLLLELDIDLSGKSGDQLIVSVESTSGTAYFDDFRFYPIESTMTSYVYDKATGQVNFILDAENLFTKYVYNDVGQLVAVYRETTENPTGIQLVSKHEINYKRPTQ